jgi:putative endopeptidase
MPSNNSITIYPAMLLPPLMPSGNVSEACSFAVFTIIGHEFTHGFDNNGAEWDKYGQRKNWWTVADRMNFNERSETLVSTYNLLELDPERDPLFFCDGKRTLGENIADLGGFLAALDAYQERLDQQGFTGETRNEQLHKFYESYAHLWCIQYGQNTFEILKYTDVHSHARLRVNGVVMNTDSWYDLYNVNQNHLLYLPAKRKTYIW